LAGQNDAADNSSDHGPPRRDGLDQRTWLEL
jgi:hypothetical protein